MLLALVALAAACGDADSGLGGPEPDRVSLAVGAGDPAPSFTGTLLSGEELSLGSLRGRPLVLNFWLTSCEPCVREMPTLAAATEADTDLVVVGVNFGETSEQIERFLAGFDGSVDFAILLDSGEITGAYQVAALPTTYFIDSAGTIRYRRVGELREEHLAVGLERITTTSR